MSEIDPLARAPRKPRSRFTEQEREAERARDQERSEGAFVDIGLGCTWKQPIRSDE